MIIQISRFLFVMPPAYILVKHLGITGALWASLAAPLSSVAVFVTLTFQEFRKAECALSFKSRHFPLPAVTLVNKGRAEAGCSG